MKKILSIRFVSFVIAAALAVAVTFGTGPQGTGLSWAQQALSYSPFGQNSAVGTFIGVANVQDSVLYDGELVMADTNSVAVTAGGIRRIGVKHYDGTSLGKARVLGIVAGDIQKSSKRGTGRVLIWGYHPAAYVAQSNLGVNQPIKIGGTVACFSALDTTITGVGYAISRTSASTSTVNTGPRYRYKVYFFGTKGVGPAAL